MHELIQHKCPNCNSSIEFDANSQKMVCPYCNTHIDVQTLLKMEEDKKKEKKDINWKTNSENTWTNDDDNKLSHYSCQSCGAQIMVDEETTATKCPYCENNIVLSDKLEGLLKPDYIIPFKLDKDAAKNGFKKHLQNKKFLPKLFKDNNHIDEIKGVYVPFWLFDCKADADINYKAEDIQAWSDSEFDYQKVTSFLVKRTGKIEFEKIPVDGSENMEDALMESLEPFNAKEAVSFETAYLSGYLAEKYGVSLEDSIVRANERVKKSVEESFRNTVTGYTNVRVSSSNIDVKNGKVHYALYPVWILNTTWNNQKYRFAMNGQTGKFVGNLPVDKKAFVGWTFKSGALMSIIVCAIIFAIYFFL